MMHRLVDRSLLKLPVFSVFLSDSDSENSDITFGGTPQKLCKDCRVALDTGTSQLAGPSDLIDDLEKRLNVYGKCSNYDNLPKLGFLVEGKIFNLSPSDYVNNAHGDYCILALMKLDVPPPRGPLFVFGIPFLQKYFTVYDHTQSRVGLAVANHSGVHPESLMDLVETEAVHQQQLWLRRGTMNTANTVPL